MGKGKIAFHINSLGKGGAEHVVSMLSGFFAEDGYEVLVITLWKAEQEYPLSGNVRRINLGDMEGQAGRWKRAVSRLTNLRRVIQRQQPSIVISFCNKANFRSAFSMLGIKIPLLVSVRNDPQKDYAPHRFSTRWMERKASGCVFQTMDARMFFSQVLQDKSKVIPNPLDEKFLGVEREISSSYFIATVGRISAQKNQLLLIKAFERICEKFQGLELRIYGETSEEEVRLSLDRYVEEHHLKDRVRFMGQCSYLERELKHAALFVLPSDYEGMPNALAEAMALGLPVIATDCPCGGCAALVENGVSGLLVPVGDEGGLAAAMVKLLSDRELSESMGRNAAQIREKISPQKVYGEWKLFVDEIINNNRY